MSLLDEMAAEGARIKKMRAERKRRKTRKRHHIKIRTPKREDLLKATGYRNYTHYLTSPEWRQIRNRVFQRDKFLCRGCGAKSECVHHKRYDLRTLKGDCLDELVSLCVNCHTAIEFDGDEKNGLKKANLKLERMLKTRKNTAIPATK